MNTDRDQLKIELKNNIITYLNLLELGPSDLEDDTPLFGEELGLDSIDSVELVVMLEREYGIKIQDPKEGRKVLVDINTIADYIIENQENI